MARCIALVAVVALLLGSRVAHARCESDKDCKGERICEDGKCAAPPPPPARCEKDTDCKGDMVCEADLCVAPARPAKAAPQSGRFTVSSSGASVLDHSTGLTWMRAVRVGSLTLTEASAYCDGITIDGVSKWRVPTEEELLAIAGVFVKDSAQWAWVDEVAFPKPVARWSISASRSVVDFDGSHHESGTGVSIRCVH